ncbi:MAG: winged helix DNA-binding domain-containing protein [Coriobacteriia bacterium]|nr:winged helix DNA-binding domain-containing protein [Coriobacteriia bacterium]
MTPLEVARLRLANQQITTHAGETPQDVVATLGGIQAQEYWSALWAVGLRLDKTTKPDIEQALTSAAIVRTWAMRGTLHFVAGQDVRWILDLLGPRVIAGSTYRRKQLEIDDLILAQSRNLFEAALADGGVLARYEAMSLLEHAGINTSGQRGIHILRHLSLEGLLCQMASEGRQSTFGLLDVWVPQSRTMDREDSLAQLAYRYFSSHGPATLRDFAWWSGLMVADAKVGIGLAAARLANERIGDTTYWMPAKSFSAQVTERRVHILPGFDEYILGYADREIALDVIAAQKIVPSSNGVFRPAVVVDGRVVGTWKPGNRKTASSVEIFSPMDPADARRLNEALSEYDRFAGRSAASAVRLLPN